MSLAQVVFGFYSTRERDSRAESVLMPRVSGRVIRACVYLTVRATSMYATRVLATGCVYTGLKE